MKQRTEQPDRNASQPPPGFQKNRGRFREVGGQVTGYYRYAGNRAEIMAHFQHREQIGKFCQRLQLRLEAEFDLAALKNSEGRKRARGVGGTPDRSRLLTEDTDQLDLMEVLAETAPAPETPASMPAVAAATDSAAMLTTSASTHNRTRNTGDEVPVHTADEIIDRGREDAASTGNAHGFKSKPEAKGKSRRTIDDALSVIQPLGPVTARTGRDTGNQKTNRADASA